MIQRDWIFWQLFGDIYYMEIRCKKENCEHNTGCSCKASKVAVDKGHRCDSFNGDPLKDTLIAGEGHIFEVAEEKVKAHLKSVPLSCTARTCLFNKETKCTANGITVIDESKKESVSRDCADCATFCEK
jgi:hypothetical protein